MIAELNRQRWLKQSGSETAEIAHLKRIRKRSEITSLLLSITPTPPELPPDLGLPAPYTLDVPRTAALTPTSLSLKSSLWPTVFAPRRKGESEPWTRGRTRWARDALQIVTQEAANALADGEVSRVRFFNLMNGLRMPVA
jgi:tRNA-specific adenosine deaminase 3